MSRHDWTWRIACAVPGMHLSKAERDAGWPPSLEVGQVARLQWPDDGNGRRRVGERALLDACESRQMTSEVHVSTIQPTISIPEPNQFASDEWLTRDRPDALDRSQVPAKAYTTTTHCITPQALSEWLIESNEVCSVHIGAWIAAVGLGETTPQEGTLIDHKVLATRLELLAAFENRGLNKAWFADLKSHKWLLDARKVKGQGTKGQVVEPLFCPYMIMNGLVNTVRATSKRLSPDTGWRVLEHKFPQAYAIFESHDPRKQTGD